LERLADLSEAAKETLTKQDTHSRLAVLYSTAKITQTTLAAKARENAAIEMLDCTFKPAINQNKTPTRERPLWKQPEEGSSIPYDKLGSTEG